MKILAVVVDILDFLDFLTSPLGEMISIVIMIAWGCWILSVSPLFTMVYIMMAIAWGERADMFGSRH